MSGFFKSKLGITLIALLSLTLGLTIGIVFNRGAQTINESIGGKVNINYQTHGTNPLEIKSFTATEEIPHQTVNEYDPSLAQGQTQVKQEGANGTKSRDYMVYLLLGKEIKRLLVSEATVTQPVNRVEVIGTYVAPEYTPVSGSGTGGSNSGGIQPLQKVQQCNYDRTIGWHCEWVWQ